MSLIWLEDWHRALKKESRRTRELTGTFSEPSWHVMLKDMRPLLGVWRTLVHQQPSFFAFPNSFKVWKLDFCFWAACFKKWGENSVLTTERTEAETHPLPCVALLPRIHALHPLRMDQKTQEKKKQKHQGTNATYSELKGNFRNVHGIMASARSINSPLSAETTFPNCFELSDHFAQEMNSNSSRARSSAKAVAASTLPHVMQQVSNEFRDKHGQTSWSNVLQCDVYQQC